MVSKLEYLLMLTLTLIIVKLNKFKVNIHITHKYRVYAMSKNQRTQVRFELKNVNQEFLIVSIKLA